MSYKRIYSVVHNIPQSLLTLEAPMKDTDLTGGPNHSLRHTPYRITFIPDEYPTSPNVAFDTDDNNDLSFSRTRYDYPNGIYNKKIHELNKLMYSLGIKQYDYCANNRSQDESRQKETQEAEHRMAMLAGI